MQIGFNSTAKTRVNKKQVTVHEDPKLVEFAHSVASDADMSLQDIVAMSINRTVSEFGRTPFLKLSGHRNAKRKKSVSQVRESVPTCRSGTRRIAAWFTIEEHAEVAAFAKEVGISLEKLAKKNLLVTLKEVSLAHKKTLAKLDKSAKPAEKSTEATKTKRVA